MSKRLVSFLCFITVIASVICAFSVPSNVVAEGLEENLAFEDAVSLPDSVQDRVLIARFENMLNHNFVYNNDFSDDQTIIENSTLALLDYVVDGEIDRTLVLNFIANMYGREVNPESAVYDFVSASDGMFAVIPRGYTVYTHKILSIENNDGGYLVHSEMSVNPHDGGEYSVAVESVFVPNSGSSFGYNIISSDYSLSNTNI